MNIFKLSCAVIETLFFHRCSWPSMTFCSLTKNVCKWKWMYSQLMMTAIHEPSWSDREGLCPWKIVNNHEKTNFQLVSMLVCKCWCLMKWINVLGAYPSIMCFLHVFSPLLYVCCYFLQCKRRCVSIAIVHTGPFFVAGHFL